MCIYTYIYIYKIPSFLQDKIPSLIEKQIIIYTTILNQKRKRAKFEAVTELLFFINTSLRLDYLSLKDWNSVRLFLVPDYPILAARKQFCESAVWKKKNCHIFSVLLPLASAGKFQSSIYTRYIEYIHGVLFYCCYTLTA